MNVKAVISKLAIGALLCLGACAETAIEDGTEDTFDARVSLDAAAEDSSEPEEDAATWDPFDAGPGVDASTELDASVGEDSSVLDAGRDSGAVDSSVPDASKPDASAPKDASVDAAPAQDASTQPDSGGGKCDPKTCTNDCGGGEGVIRCCKDNNTCGCTWFPVYCS